MVKFKITPFQEGGDKFYEAIIFPTLEAMYKYYKDTGGYQELDFIAVCRDLEIYKGDIQKNKIGEILFSKDSYDYETIIHECGHATFQFIRKEMKNNMWTFDNKNNTSLYNMYWDGEEFYCKILGNISKQLIDKLNNLAMVL